MPVDVLLLALLLDAIAGEPAARVHPVVWMGRLITVWRKAPIRHRFLYGGLTSVAGVSIIYLAALLAMKASQRLPYPLRLLVRAWLLKTTFSVRALDAAARDVENALCADNLDDARRLLGWHLVSRDTSQLTASQVAAAAVESVAENTSDGIIAPLCWYAVGGIPAALIYRYVNTADAMLGYRDHEREWLGKIPARLDDLANVIPARLTAILFLAWNPRAASIWRRDARLTDSPNAGHPMSAAAGVLDIELEKVGQYRLNSGAHAPHCRDIRRIRRMLPGVVGIFVMLMIISRYLWETLND